jgi:hypothetical protein
MGIVAGDENSASYFYQQNSLRDALAAASTLNIFNVRLRQTTHSSNIILNSRNLGKCPFPSDIP